MTSLRPALLLSLLVLLAPSAHAEAFGDPLGRLFLSFDPAVQSEVIRIDQFRPFSFYLVADASFAEIGRPDLDELSGIEAWEAGVRIPPQLLILERGVPSSCCGADCLQKQDHQDNWIVQLCSAGVGHGEPVVLVRYLAMLGSLDSRDLSLGLSASWPSRFGQQAAASAPGWLEQVASGSCAAEPCWRPFAEWSGNGLTINPVGVPLERESWSGLKSRY